MTAQEQLDLDVMLAAIRELKIKAYDAIQSVMRYTSEDLKHSGHKTHDDAVQFTFHWHEKQIEALRKAHLRKYPD